MSNHQIMSCVAFLCGLVSAVASGQSGSASGNSQSPQVPFASKKNQIELVVLNKGLKGAQEFVVSAHTVPSWLHYTDEVDTIQIGLKEKEAIAQFEFAIDPTAPVGDLTPLHFTVRSISGQMWSKELKIVVAAPRKFELLQNYPNPFNPITTIGYHLSYEVRVSLKVFDVLGREVATLVDEVQQAGQQEKSFDAGSFSSGVYFYKLQAGNYSAVKKLMLLK